VTAHRYITPEALLEIRFRGRARPQWDIGVLCFRDTGGSEALVRALGARPVPGKTLYGLEGSAAHPGVFELALGRYRIGIVARCLWGAPQAAILVEELACLGARVVLGYGAAGGLVPELPKGTQLMAGAGLATDGTSRAYTSRLEVPADAGLVDLLGVVAARLGVTLPAARVATVDALFRETGEDVQRWLGLGAQAINMETAPLYAAAAACGIRSLWLGHVSDTLSLTTAQWESWERPPALTDVTVALTVGLLEELSTKAL
jgi:purine-nucleoside phosphorylase